eukprot:14585436-Alexandrium_andersonii.AAC.1
MRNRFRRSKLKLRGPGNGHRLRTRSSRGVPSASSVSFITYVESADARSALCAVVRADSESEGRGA